MANLYCGVGSRKVPREIAAKMTKYSSILERLGYTLRSGKALGSDQAFEKGVINKKFQQSFTAREAKEWAFDYVRYCMPNDRPGYGEPKGYLTWQDYVKGLLARNMMQVLGENGDEPVEFLVCWTPAEDYATSKVGGTGYAIRCAQINNIPVYNLVYPDQVKVFEDLLRDILRKNLLKAS